MHEIPPLSAIVSSIHHLLILPVDDSVSLIVLSPSCPPPRPSISTISQTICHFKSILTFILHPSIQFLNILPPPILQVLSTPLLPVLSAFPSSWVKKILHLIYDLTKYLNLILNDKTGSNGVFENRCVTMYRHNNTDTCTIVIDESFHFSSKKPKDFMLFFEKD